MAGITREIFISATGLEPEPDDLERSNCPLAGRPMHSQCGWDEELNLPVFIALAQRKLVDRLAYRVTPQFGGFSEVAAPPSLHTKSCCVAAPVGENRQSVTSGAIKFSSTKMA